MEYKELQKMTITDLREMGEKYEDLEGVTGMKKEVLIDVLCKKMGIEKKHHVPKGIGRKALKERIKALKARRDEALSAHDHKALKRTRTLIRRTKHTLRKVVLVAEHAEDVKEQHKQEQEKTTEAPAS